MLALTCDVCNKPATVFFKDGGASCNNHGQYFMSEQDFRPTTPSDLGLEMVYDYDERYVGTWPKA